MKHMRMKIVAKLLNKHKIMTYETHGYRCIAD